MTNERIINALTGYGREEGIAFISPEDAEKYWQGLVNIIQDLINEEVDAAQTIPGVGPCVCNRDNCDCPQHAKD